MAWATKDYSVLKTSGAGDVAQWQSQVAGNHLLHALTLISTPPIASHALKTNNRVKDNL